MRFLSVAERELQSASRRVGTYRTRWLAAAGFLLLLLWMAWVYDLFQNRNAGPEVFRAASLVIFFYCLFVGAAGTADCLSREKRDGTLGLLFLTNLNSAEIVLGKLCSNGLMLIYSLVAIFPILALPVLIGGISAGNLGRTVLALANALLCGVAMGFVASAVSVRQFPAVALATSLTLLAGATPLLLAEVLPKMSYPQIFATMLSEFCPLNILNTADDAKPLFKAREYWLALAGSVSFALGSFAFVAWIIGKTWRDRPKSVPLWSRVSLGKNFRERSNASRKAFRRRLLAINPIFWLAGRQRISAPVFMLITVVLVLVTEIGSIKFFSGMFGTGALNMMEGRLFAWAWTGVVIHLFSLYYGATVASQRLAEDKQTGALELILSTPTSERAIARGLWMAYGRKMSFPAVAAVSVHFFFIWQCLAVLMEEASSKISRHISLLRFGLSAIFYQPIDGVLPEWHVGFILRFLLLLLVAVMANWLMLGWFARWLGLRMKYPGFAPTVAVALAVVPPIGEFSFICYLFSKSSFFHMPEQQILLIMMWIAFGIVVGNCLLLSTWAAGKLRRELREVISSRFERATARSWRPSRATMGRVMRKIAATFLVLVVMGCLFF
ncbi:MAG: ABC transporter permease subunit, partial [Verrucomicrobiota bacterium]